MLTIAYFINFFLFVFCPFLNEMKPNGMSVTYFVDWWEYKETSVPVIGHWVYCCPVSGTGQDWRWVKDTTIPQVMMHKFRSE